MEQSVQELCWLLQEVLFEQIHDFQITDSERLYRIAKENGLSGTVFEVIQNHGVSSLMYPKFQKDFFKYVAQDEEQMHTIDLIKGLFHANNIKHVFLKGSILKNIYPKSYMRAMGDIDLLIQEKDKQEVGELLKRFDIQLKSRNYVHDVYEMKSMLTIEVHSRLTKEKNSVIDLEDITSIVKGYSFPHELEVLYLLAHLKKHLVTSGIGLRSVLDIGLYLHHYASDMNQQKLFTLLEKNQYSTFFQQIVRFNEMYLNLPFDEWKQTSEEQNEVLFDVFTNYIIESGIHGLGISFNKFGGIVSAKKSSAFRRLRTLLYIVFLPYKDLKYSYPRILKYRILLPIAWIIRIFNLLFTKRQRRMYQLKKLYGSNQMIDETTELFKKLGI